MPTRQFQLFCSALLLLLLISYTSAETKYRTPARILAKQTGATQFEEERYETHTNCNEHKHHLKKRASDEDVDYEVYQGVVGRPGIDFPIYPRIPKTSFSCRSFGNGYFADMETDCQVFHICEEGRKISFLCPNGTIFQQSELTCDWWFKVNCLGSSGYYAESAEILNKQRVHRVRPSVPVQGFNIVGGGLNYKPKVAVVGQARTKSNGGVAVGGGKSDRRIDSNEEIPSLESVDFDDVSGEKQRKVIANIDNNSNDNESQITAESASFVANNKRRNNYEDNVAAKVISHEKPTRRSNTKLQQQQQQQHQQQHHGVSTERARNGNRGQQRYRDNSKDTSSFETSVEQQKKSAEKPEFYEAHSSQNVENLQQNTTPHFAAGTYTTARRFADSTRATPYYTPTVPSLSKTKSTEGKTHYIKGNNPGAIAATTPNPNRFNAGGGAGVFHESSAAPRPTASGAQDAASATFKPIIIGMRHHYEIGVNSGELPRFSLSANTPIHVEQNTKLLKSKPRDYLPSTTTTASPSSNGPTYLPKSAAAPKSNNNAAAADGLLFAPNPVKDESITRNLNDMLKTMNLLKHNFDDVEIGLQNTATREGLEIPPSSGPDALVSLAKYFAQEHNDSKISNALDNAATAKVRLPVKMPVKPSDATATITTPSTPHSISQNADDIKSSLLSQKTVNKYTDLFGLKAAKNKAFNASEGLLKNVNETNTKDAEDTFAEFPQIGSTGATIRELAEKPETRKIAQVFSNAINSYLKDPEVLRAELANARPTEPPNFKPITTTDRTLFSDGTARTYLPTKSTPEHTTPIPNIAAEINHKFVYTTTAADYATTTTTESYAEGTTYRNSKEQPSLELSAELAPPSIDSVEDDEVLHRLQTQSFVKSGNELITNKQRKRPEKLIDAHKPTEHPWTLKSQTDFLDPLTINDGLMNKAEQRSTTASPFTYLPKESTTTTSRNNGRIQILATDAQRARLSESGGGGAAAAAAAAYEWDDIFNSYDIPRDALPSSSGLQRIANKLFGGLNEQEALHLKSVMAHAEHNRQVLSLLLLLIQTCDDQNGKALERSRKHLLNALIDIDSKLKAAKLTQQKENTAAKISMTTTARTPVTTFRRGNEDFYTSTTPLPATTTTTTPATATKTTTDLAQSTTTLTPLAAGSYEETTKFEIRVEDPDEDYGSSTTIAPNHAAAHPTTNSDRRALELLKSLYSLASKFSSRR